MRAVVQRAVGASVTVNGKIVGTIGAGLVVFLGVGNDDSAADADYLANKIAGLRIFEDEKGLMNLSVQDIAGGILAISQFTLYGDCRKGRRPGFSDAAPPQMAEELYDYFWKRLVDFGIPVETGQFQAEMKILVENDGPVTILLDSKKLF